MGSVNSEDRFMHGMGPGGRQVLAASLLTCGDAVLLLPSAQDFDVTQFTSTQIKADQAISGIGNLSPIFAGHRYIRKNEIDPHARVASGGTAAGTIAQPGRASS
jgi:hypothetical protein